MKKLYTNIFAVILSVVMASLFTMPFIASAQVDPLGSFQQSLQQSGLTQSGAEAPKLEDAIGLVINSILVLVGIATFVLVIYAGATWILARGNATKVEQAQKILLGSVVGLIIIFTAFIAVNFVLDALSRATQGGAPVPATQQPVSNPEGDTNDSSQFEF